MPIYSYTCDECGHKDEIIRNMRDSDIMPACICGEEMRRDILAEHRTAGGTGDFHTPIQMMSVGLDNLSEIRDFQRKNPNIEISDNIKHPECGVPIARNRREKLQILKHFNFVELK